MLKDKSKTDIAKSVARFVVARCVGTTISTVITQNVEVEKPVDKAQIVIGSHVIGSLVAKQTETYVDEKIDYLVATWIKLKQISNPDNPESYDITTL